MNDLFVAKTSQMIIENNYLSLATADNSGKPWIAAVFYAFDDDCNFYFFSAKDSLHAKHIRSNSRAAISIFNSGLPPDQVDGVQVECVAQQAPFRELPHIILLYYHRRFPDSKERAQHEHVPLEFKGIALRRFFKLTPVKVYTLDPNSSKVDRRVEVNIADLREALHERKDKA